MADSKTFFDRFMSCLIPGHFLSGRYAYHVNVLIFFSLSAGGLAILILSGLIFTEGDVAPRRMVTVLLACLFLFSIPLMWFVKNIHILAWYVICVTLAFTWYVDFNNQSLAGPSTSLWVIPFALSGLVFSRFQLFLVSLLIVSLFTLNGLLLFLGVLPPPLIPPNAWPVVEAVYLCAAGLIVIVCTRGMARLAHNQMDDLQDKLDEKQRHLKEINELKIKAEASTNSKSMFLATVTHELRTPLNSVIGNAQLLEKVDLPAGPKARIEDISLAGRLLLTLINNILDFSKLEQNELTFIESTYDIKHQLTHLCRMLENRLQPGVDLKLTLPDEEILILADQSRVAQVVMNLLSNAFKFTSEGHVELALIPYDNGDIELAVSDTGAGIDALDIENLFNQFSQVAGDSAKNIEGTGLGLAICKGIIEQMDGRIDVTSTPTIGSRFSIYLPNRIQKENTIDPKAEPEIELCLQDISILVVDDIVMNCIVLEGMLEDFNANKVSVVNSGEDAVSFIEQHADTHVILMDIRMPTMSGIEATELIRSMGYKGIIIAVTANAADEDKAECIASGMNDFLSKPIEMSGLKRSLANLLS